MSKYAIIQLVGKQFKVQEGDKITVDRLNEKDGKTCLPAGTAFTVKDVLLVGDEKSQKIGTPLVDKASVTLKVLSHQKGDKIRVAKFKAKSRYRRVKGHRQHQSTLEVTKITA